ncbi:MAG: 2-amino-4-hydroxy-6-hydroxymethyldihydropteridine diphosphokinase [Puniceicoccales bacterium]|jgi:2-amino-4-hydroxy-6-hydroxymethyldihydropteridine diphosphokinase|nr:2-amino-4-hydroxy-6-hydroxymethyldihydropteridine diphosphokinase [Puniceicoccales bacterium]
MNNENEAYLALGSNLGDRLGFLTLAVSKLKCDGLKIEKCSNVYETEPQILADQPNFLNCVLFVKTALNALQLLSLCQDIECSIGKNKTTKFGPRNIDIDLLTFNSEKISTPDLIIPHPRMFERSFVLTPLGEIVPNLVIENHHIGQLIAKCAGQKTELFAGKDIFDI